MPHSCGRSFTYKKQNAPISFDADSRDDDAETMIKPTVEIPPMIPWTMRRTRRKGRLEINPINNMITAWENNPLIKRTLGLIREASDPQKVEASAAAKLGAPIINPTHISVC